MLRISTLTMLLIAVVTMVACQTTTPERTEASEIESEELEVATLAGGCFWCMQPPFDRLEGVESTIVGYTGGVEESPVYQEVAGGQTSHVEAVQVRFDPEVVTYEEVLDVFWRSIDPTDDGGQFADRGDHYRTAIFVHDDIQRQVAEDSRDELARTGPFDDPIVTEIRQAETFWVGEEYHQDYYLKNPDHYQSYYVGSGRAGFLEDTWQ